MPDIRPLSASDRPEWARLRHALWPHIPLADLEDELSGFTSKAEDTFAVGAFQNASLVGFAEAAIRSMGSGGGLTATPWLEGVYVSEAMRGVGLARELVAAVEHWARTRGFNELGSDARLDNAISIARHRQWGFSEAERVVIFRKALE